MVGMKKNLYIRYIILIFAVATIATAMGKSPRLAPSYAWTTLPPLGLHQEATIDTLLYNYYQKSVPSEVSPAYATTGNLGAEGMNMIFLSASP